MDLLGLRQKEKENRKMREGVESVYCDASFKIEEFYSGVMRVHVRRYLRERELNAVPLEMRTRFIEGVARELVLEVSTYVLANLVHEEPHALKFTQYLTWWDHFKATYFRGTRLEKYFPVRSKPHEIHYSQTYHMCPHHNLPFDSDSRHVKFVTYEREKVVNHANQS